MSPREEPLTRTSPNTRIHPKAEPSWSKRLIAFTKIVGAVAAALIGLGALFGVPQSIEDGLRHLPRWLYHPSVDLSGLSPLRELNQHPTNVSSYMDLLGGNPSIRGVSVEAWDPASKDGTITRQPYKVFYWSDPDQYEISALVDPAGAVQAYKIRSMSSKVQPALLGPDLEGELGKSMFVDWPAGPMTRSAEAYANTTRPLYIETYALGTPFYDSFALSLGGHPNTDTQDNSLDDIFDLIDKGGEDVSCLRNARSCASEPAALKQFKATHAPDTLVLASDKLDIDEALKAFL